MKTIIEMMDALRLSNLTEIHRGRMFKWFSSFLILFVVIGPVRLMAQTDTQFWFVVPEITWAHNTPGGVPANLRLSTMAFSATVTISMPANQYNAVTNPTGFHDIVVNIPANSSQSVDMAPFIRKVPAVAGELGEANIVENKPYTISGVNNVGLHITSTNVITAYYEDGNWNNSDIWALKGKNALGTDFYTPFQNQTPNHAVGPPYPYSAIDIVATEDNTIVTIYPTKNASYGLGGSIAAGASYSVILNKGQTFSVFPAGQARTAAAHLGGTHVTATKKIAITLKDDSIDHTSGTCFDVVGDQLIPTNIIGWDYIAIRTQLFVQDHIYITATQNGTTVDVYYGAATHLTYTLNAGQQQYVPFPNNATTPSMRITSDVNHPIYVFHIGGFGCEQGGAILPPINVCTGSTQVAFTRSNTQAFYINLMVRQGAEANFLMDGLPMPLLVPAAFQTAPGPSLTKWKVAQFGPYSTAQIPVGGHLITNTGDLFHMGIVNGGTNSGCMYGYFSDFNELKVNAVVAGTGSSSVLKTCFGTPVQLYATGGTNFTWTPGTSLSNDTIFNPFANPSVTTQYKVVVEGACEIKDSAFITVAVSTPISANFSTDKVTGCSPLTVTFTDHSSGVTYWQYDFGDSTAIVNYGVLGSITYPSLPAGGVIPHVFHNPYSIPITYHVQLLAKNADQCSELYYKDITVYPDMNAAFTTTVTSNCNPKTVGFTNTSTTNTADSYLWDYGDGFSQTMANTGPVSHIYNNILSTDAIYPMQLIATSPYGCKDTASQNITVAAYIKADFDIDKVAGCSPLNVVFTNKAAGGIASWTLTNFGSGPQPANPATPGNYTLTYNNTNATATDIINNLTLTVTNSSGCSSSMTKPVTVYPEVHAAITTVPAATAFCQPAPVTFGSGTSTGPINTYAWTFGDGGTSSLNNPSHTYVNNTNFTSNPNAILVVTSIRGCTDTIKLPLTIYSLVEADFSVDTPKFCSPFKILIDDNSQGGIVTYHWDYGDGSPINFTSSDHTHTYTNVGAAVLTRTLDLIVTNEGGCPSNTSRFITVYPEVHTNYTLDNSVDCNPVLTTFGYTGTSTATLFDWTFGDGGSSVMQNPIHEFTNDTPTDITYTVQLVGNSIYGCTDTLRKTVTVYSKVDANFAINKSFGCSPLGVDINNVLWGGNSAYRWDWDGNSMIDSTTNTTTSLFRHTYINQTGLVQNIPLTLNVQNTHGCPDQMVRFVQVYPEVTAAYTPINQTGCNPFPLTFSNTSILTGSVTKPDYNSWWFGDGGTSNLLNPSHQFVNSSAVNDITYNMWLAASTIYGCVDTLKTNITVHPRLDASFVIDSASRCTPFFLPITPTAIGATTYQWIFGDGTANGNSSVPFQHQYDNPDPNNLVTYPLSLIVTNGGGACHDTLVRPVRVYPKVISKFIPDKVAGCNPLTVTFTNQSTGNATYVWDFGNSASSNVLNPTVVYEHADRTTEHTYTVTLKTNNDLGCESLSDTVITVYPKVEAEFAADNTAGCSPLTLNLNNLTVSPAYDYQWGINSMAPFSTAASPSALNLVNPTNAPPVLQVDTLKLITYYKNSHTCSATAKKIVTIYPRVYPDFSMNAAGCQPFPVTFTNTTQSVNGTATYHWNFGNQISSIDKNPSTTYFNTDFNTNKTYDVSLIATSENYCVDSVHKVVTVYPKPFASYKFVSPTIACAPFNFELQNVSLGTNLSYYYDFGDGSDLLTTSTGNITHPYQNLTANVASYLLKLRTTTQYGCKDSTSQMVYTYPMVTAAFNFDPLNAHCNPYTVNLVNSSVNTYNYSWDFGDGQGTGLENPSHLFINNTELDKVYNVKLTAASQYECSDTISHNMTIYAAPVAAFQPDPPLKIFPDATFGIENQTKPAADTWNYRWTMGDGQTRFGKDFNTYTYSHWGPKADGFRYEVILESWNNNCYDSTHRYIYVLPAPPVASYASDTSATCSPLIVHFYNNSLYGDSLRWNFGDGGTSTEWEPIHTFYSPGYYNVKLTIYGDGGVAYRYKTFHVFQNAVANFEVDPHILLLPDADAHFFNTSENATRYYWEFGEAGGTSIDKDPTFRYSSLGVYNVKLTVWTDPLDGNCQDDTTIVAVVRVIGQGKIAYPNAFTPSQLGPNGGAYDDVDYQNQVFHPVWEGVSKYILRIYNRWGEQIFESHDVKVGWDGYYRGKLCEPDVYVWKAEGTFTNGQHFSKMGDITLIR